MDVAEYLQITDFDTEELVQWGEMTLCVRASDTMVCLLYTSDDADE